MPPKKVKVLVVEDSLVARELIIRLVNGDPELEVVGWVGDGAETLPAIERLRPDVVTMDIHMPRMDGYRATRQIMETRPLPIVIVSASVDSRDTAQAFRALEAGAVAAVEKPGGPGSEGAEQRGRRLVDTIKAMAEVKVVRRWPNSRSAVRSELAPRLRLHAERDQYQIVAIGASTGGPPVLRALLEALPKPFPVPVAIVQHISVGFVSGLADWLTDVAGLPVSVARGGDIAIPGHAYLAPDGCHTGITPQFRISCTLGEPEHGLRPAVSHLFRSVAASFGPHAVGVLLTGMGRDGAQELRLLRDAGALTFAQDKESSVVNGMPGAAVELGGAMHILPPPQIAATLGALFCPP